MFLQLVFSFDFSATKKTQKEIGHLAHVKMFKLLTTSGVLEVTKQMKHFNQSRNTP